MTQNLKKIIKDHKNFPINGIIFKDILPLLQHPDVFSKVIEEMSASQIFKNADAILSIDARAVARLTTVVVLPTPPFWLAIVIIILHI